MVQVSLSVLLLIGAGLLIRTLEIFNTSTRDSTQTICCSSTWCQPARLQRRQARESVSTDRFSRLEAVPGVQSVTFSRSPLLSQRSWTGSVYVPGEIGSDGQPRESDAKVHSVRENFFSTMEIPLLMGRGLTEQDDARAPRVAVVNQAFVKAHFPNESPIGKRFGFEPDKPSEIEIVGIARDAKYTSQRDEVQPTVYQSWRQVLRKDGSCTFEVRTTGDPDCVIVGPYDRRCERSIAICRSATSVRRYNKQMKRSQWSGCLRSC